jgi:outer membrane biosynthesis protein TonB
MQRVEQTGLGISVVGHVAIFTILSLGLFAASKPSIIPPTPIDVQIVDQVGLTDTAPEPPKVAPAQSVAPVVGPPEEAEPEPAPQPAPTPPAPAPVQREAVPPPKPAPITKPTPPKPAPVTKPVAKPAAKPTPPAAKPATAKPAVKPSVTPARGSKLGDDFRKGLTAAPSTSTSQAPRVATVGPAQLAGLAAAIRRQVQPCADRITSPGPGAERITTKINLQMNRDGSFAANPRVVSQVTDEDNARYGGRVGELAKAAFVQCSPFELPAELYDGWKNINLNYKLPG